MKGSKCSLSCNNGYRLSKTTLLSYSPVFTLSSLEKKYIRRCLKGGVWSPSKPNFTCEGDGKKKKFIHSYFIWCLSEFIGGYIGGKNKSAKYDDWEY